MAVSVKKSGANIHLQLIGETYDAFYCGTREVGTSQVPLVLTSMPCFGVQIQASNNNNAWVYIGNETQGCYQELPAGATITIPINDVAKVYVRAASGTQRVNFMAML